MEENKKMENEELEKVSGGTYYESDEITRYIRAHFPEVNADSWHEICQFVDRKLNIEIVENYNSTTPNNYYMNGRTNGQWISHDQVMQKLRQLAGE